MNKYKKLESIYEQGVCVICNINKQTSSGVNKINGKKKYKAKCSICHKNQYGGDYRYRYRKHKKTTCEKCGFIPVHLCQLDVDHIDGDHDNPEESNLQTLCANCHRLKSHKERNHVNIQYRENQI